MSGATADARQRRQWAMAGGVVVIAAVLAAWVVARGRCARLPHVRRSHLEALGCVIDRCADPWGDCDGVPGNGCEARVDTAARCGACGARCALPDADARCEDGRCAVAACRAGRADCDRDPDNGCETDPATDARHCGACGRACALPNAGARCAGGRCAVASCAAGWGDCDGDPRNGCERDVARDAASCGACGRACPPSALGRAGCAGGRCFVACASGALDCDGDPANGCEVRPDDPAHCGGCGVRCAGSDRGDARCVRGACVARCRAPWADCDRDGVCETDTAAPCSVGVGACARPGRTVCDGARGVRCEGAAGEPAAETCNGADDDCDGETDDLAPGTPCALGPCEVGRRSCAPDPSSGGVREVCARVRFVPEGTACADSRTEAGGVCREGLCVCPTGLLNCHGRCVRLGRACTAVVGGCPRRGMVACSEESVELVCYVDGGPCVAPDPVADGGTDSGVGDDAEGDGGGAGDGGGGAGGDAQNAVDPADGAP